MENAELHKLFVPREIAKQLKEKGFNEPCLGYYNSSDEFVLGLSKPITDGKWNCLSRPMYQQVVDWFLEKHLVRITQEHQTITGMWFCSIWKWNGEKWNKLSGVKSFQYIHEALNEIFEEALKLI